MVLVSAPRYKDGVKSDQDYYNVPVRRVAVLHRASETKVTRKKHQNKTKIKIKNKNKTNKQTTRKHKNQEEEEKRKKGEEEEEKKTDRRTG